MTCFPAENAAVAAKGCTGWSVAMTLYRHPDCQLAACLPMQSLTILTTVHPRATAWPSLHRKASHEIFSRLWLPANFVRLPPLKGAQDISAAFYFYHSSRGARVSDEKTRFPLRGSAAVAAKGCTGWSVAMTRCCQSRPPNGGLLTDAGINDSYCSTPLRHCVALSPSRGRKGLVLHSTLHLKGAQG